MRYQDLIINKDNYRNLLLKLWFNYETGLIGEAYEDGSTMDIESFLEEYKEYYWKFIPYHGAIGQWSEEEAQLAEWLEIEVEPLVKDYFAETSHQIMMEVYSGK